MMRPSVVFLHGFTCNNTVWEHQTRHFSGCARVLAPDLPFHGQSLMKADPTVEGVADALAAHLRSEQAVPSVVVGHSFGGMVALMLALRTPEAVRGIVLADAFPSLALTRTYLPEMHGPETPEAVRQDTTALMRRGWDTMSPDSRDRLWRSIETVDVSNQLPRIHAPLLAVYGGRGRYKAHEAERLRRDLRLDRVPQSRVVIFPGAGHFVQLEHPARFNTLLEDFLR